MASGPDPGGRARFAKLGMAINEELTQAYRDILEMDVPPSLIYNKVKSSSIYKRLRSDQELLLNDAKNSGYKNFDITLMYTLLRNICTKIPLPTNGWGKDNMPSTGEITVGDDIERIRLIRNNVFGHVNSASTSQKTFDDSWSVISDVCQRLQTYTGKNYMDCLGNIERQTLEEEHEEAIIGKLQADYGKNKAVLEMVSTLISDVQEIKEELKSNKKEQRNADILDVSHNDKDGQVSLKEAIIASWKMENKSFVPTIATKMVEEKLENKNFIIVVGNSGSGKTAMIQHIALNYQEKGWDIVPIDEVREIKEMCSYSINHRLFILNDPIGKEKLDEISYNSWKSHEKTIEVCLQKSKMLVSCRRCVIKDKRLQGLLKEESSMIEIDIGANSLTHEEKYAVIKQYVQGDDLSEDDIEEIMKTDAYFPLLCKLLSVDPHYRAQAVGLFKRPFDIVRKEIETYKEISKEKYCALVLLSMFNSIDIDQIKDSEVFRKRFDEIAEACELPSSLPLTSICRNLRLLEGSFVKCIGNTFFFIHDFVMEVTTLTFGTDFPKETIKYADSGFLRKRLKIKENPDKPDPLTVYLHPMHIGDLVERLFIDIKSDCIFDVVLNPCLRSKIVIEKFIEKIKSLDNLSMFYTERTISIDSNKYGMKTMDNTRMSRLQHISLEENMTPISILIAFCHDEISAFCLNNTDSAILQNHFLLPAVCANGSIELFNLLKEKTNHMRINKSWGKMYPIHIASTFHNLNIVERLLQLGANPNERTGFENTPLMMAACGDEHNIEVNRQGGMRRNHTIECLIKYGAKVNLCGNLGYSPLHNSACREVPENTTELLISYGADINLCCNSRKSPLYLACLFGHDNTVKVLLDNDANIHLSDDKGNTPFHVACEKGYRNIAKRLLESGAKINSCNTKGESALLTTCCFGNDSTVKFLVQNDANVNLCCNEGMSPLFISCEKGFENKVKILLNNGADVNLCDKRRLSPIGIASYKGRNNIIHLLLDKAADVNLCCIDGRSPLYLACGKEHDSTAKLLLQKGADVNLCERGIYSPIYIACFEGFCNIIKLLLENGADINAYDERGHRPIFRACKLGHKNVVRLLMEHGADINLRDNYGKTAVDIASDLNREDIVNLMLSYFSKK